MMAVAPPFAMPSTTTRVPKSAIGIARSNPNPVEASIAAKISIKIPMITSVIGSLLMGKCLGLGVEVLIISASP